MEYPVFTEEDLMYNSRLVIWCPEEKSFPELMEILHRHDIKWPGGTSAFGSIYDGVNTCYCVDEYRELGWDMIDYFAGRTSLYGPIYKFVSGSVEPLICVEDLL